MDLVSGEANPYQIVFERVYLDWGDCSPPNGYAVEPEDPRPTRTDEPTRPTMERTRTSPTQPSRTPRNERQLAPLKLISRLLGHELHAQQSPRVTLSREELVEVQTTIDLYIELATGRGGRKSAASEMAGELEVQAVPARVN